MAFLISSGKANSGLIPDQLRLQISEITGYLPAIRDMRNSEVENFDNSTQKQI